MAEWLKAHAWKACIPQGIPGSNPLLSATHFHPVQNPICLRADIIPLRWWPRLDAAAVVRVPREHRVPATDSLEACLADSQFPSRRQIPVGPCAASEGVHIRRVDKAEKAQESRSPKPLELNGLI